MTIPTAEITENERVGREIKAWLARHSLKQTDLADVIGVAQKNVSRRLRGEIPFRIDELLAITQALDITLGQLLGNDLVNEKNPHLVSGEGSRGQTSGHFVAGDGFEPSTSGL
ncbi:helix-turn-helix domain-containing protein [Garicola koreensis]|uniref:helix-turn-helix transcriptional regulator n=1 Tax=Garicola koreensis TaxID=1262554 RepID=UPI001609D23F